MKRNTRSSIWRYLPGILVSLLAVFFLSRLVNPEDLARSIGLFSILDILILCAIMFLSLICRGMAWKSLLSGISIRDGFLVINEGYLLNNIIPRSGEVARIFITSSLTKNDAFHAGAAIFFERAVDLLVAAGMFLGTLPYVIEMQWLRATAIWIVIAFSLLLLLVPAAAYFSSSLERFFQSRNFKNETLDNKLKPLLIRALHGLTSISQPSKLAPALLWILCSWSLWVFILAFAIGQLNPDGPLWWALFTQGVVALGIALPSAPANLGVYEGTIVFALAIFGIDGDTALGAAIILHLIQIGMTTLFGLAGMFAHDFRLGQLIERIRNRLNRKDFENQEN